MHLQWKKIEYLKNNELEGSMEIGVSPKVGFQMKTSKNTNVLSSEWQLDTSRDNSILIFSWKYSKNSNNVKKHFAPGLHECSGLIVSKHMCGFRITITHVYKFEFRNAITSFLKGKGKSKLIKCS